jgi:hypothetical protein
LTCRSSAPEFSLSVPRSSVRAAPEDSIVIAQADLFAAGPVFAVARAALILVRAQESRRKPLQTKQLHTWQKSSDEVGES